MKIDMDEGFDYLAIDKVIDPDKATCVISSKSMPDWKTISTVRQFPNRIRKDVIPIDFARYRMSIVTRVEPGVKVGRHAHEEPVFRYVIEGTLTLNSVNYGPGDWILVPSKTPYEVSTETGYTVLAEYGQRCGGPPDRQIHRNEST